MPPAPRSAVAVLAVAACAAGVLVAPGSAGAATCAATPSLLSRTPSSYPLPGGASVRIWDTGNLSDNLKEIRLAVVKVPAGTLTPSVATSSAVSSVATPSTMVSADPNAVVAINAGHFNPTIPGVPVKWQEKNDVIRKGSSTATGPSPCTQGRSRSTSCRRLSPDRWPARAARGPWWA